MQHFFEGAGFTAYLVSSLTVKEDGTYDFDSVTPGGTWRKWGN